MPSRPKRRRRKHSPRRPAQGRTTPGAPNLNKVRGFLGRKLAEVLETKYSRTEAANIARSVGKYVDDLKARRRINRRENENRKRQKLPRVVPPPLEFFPGKGRGRFNMVKSGKILKKGMTRRQVRRALALDRNQRQVDALVKATGLTKKKVRGLIAEIRRGAEREIRKLKRSKTLTPKQKRKLSLARARRRAMAALWDTIYNLGGY